MSLIEHGDTGSNMGRPVWWTPGMSDADARIWAAAQRAADSAPDLTPGDDVYLRLRQLMGGCLAPARDEREAA